MYLVASCLNNEDIVKLYDIKSCKFFNVSELINEFKELNKIEQNSVQYFDVHFNNFLQIKLQNCLKNIKTQYLIYNLQSCDVQTLHNIKKFISEKKEKKIKGFIYVGRIEDEYIKPHLEEIGYVFETIN
jgi:hypothetical protein